MSGHTKEFEDESLSSILGVEEEEDEEETDEESPEKDEEE